MNKFKGLTVFEDEYIKDGVIYCKKCNTKRSLEVSLFNKKKIVRCMCDCEKEEERKKKENLDFIDNQIKIEKLIKKSLIGEKYKNVTFENTNFNDNNPDYKNAYLACLRYCDKAEEKLKEGKGFYMFGDPGVGKTYLIACVANRLLQNKYSVLFTNGTQISQMIKNTYDYNSTESEDDILNRITSVDFLIIDDFGTEKFFTNGEDTWLQNIIYQIINQRYNDLKPIIFTSNYSLTELIIDKNLYEKTIDRMCEICGNVIKINGKGFRV